MPEAFYITDVHNPAVVNLVLQRVGSGTPEYWKVNIKWSQTQMCTIRQPIACITGDITNGTQQQVLQVYYQ